MPTSAPGTAASDVPAVGPRQPCPCGSGKRYKACHGQAGGADVYVRRPFEGLPSECDVVAMRELVPAASAPLPIADTDREVLLCTVLPGMAPGLSRASGQVWLGLQVQHAFGDPSRELTAVLDRALEVEAAAVVDDEESAVIGLTTSPGAGPRLQDRLVPGSDALTVTVHDGFDFWLADVEDPGEAAAALEQANASLHPTTRLTSVEAGYWTSVGPKEYLRWVMPEPEDALLDALARLHAAGRDVLVPQTRLIGTFRAHGLLAPVWDLPVGTGADAVEEPAAAFRAALDEALAETGPLTAEERSARASLASRQVTIRQ